MNPREKLLGGLVVVILIALGARSVHNHLNESYRRSASQETNLRDTLFEEERKVAAGQDAAGRLAQWRERSLPADKTDANLTYQIWLLDELDEAGLENVEAPVSFTARPGDGHLLSYAVTAEGTLEEITKFLYRFYEANFLHKISKIVFTPDDAGRTLQVVMTVDAWALEDSLNPTGLPEGQSNRLALDSLEKYQESIVARNIFAMYTPPPPPRDNSTVVEKEEDPPFDHAQHARATGVVESNGKPQVWIYVLTTGEKFWLNEGETFKVGDLEFRIVKIDPRSIIYEAEGKQYTVKLGKYLHEREPVISEQAS